MRDWLTVDETCAKLGLSRARIVQLRGAGELTSDRDAEGRVRVSRESVQRLLDERELAQLSAADRARRAAEQADAREDWKRRRAEADARKAELAAEHRALLRRAVEALERIAADRVGRR